MPSHVSVKTVAVFVIYVTHPNPSRERQVSKESKKALHEKLESYRQSLIPANLDNVQPVSFPTMFLEFGHVQISQVLDNCHLLFDFQDIKDILRSGEMSMQITFWLLSMKFLMTSH